MVGSVANEAETELREPKLTVSEIKAQLRAAGVSEFDIKTCLDRTQLEGLLAEHTDTTYAAACILQRHWRSVLDRRRAAKAVADLQHQGIETSKHGEDQSEEDVFADIDSHEIEFIRDVFQKIDDDGSGEIDAEELREALGMLGQDQSDENVNKMMESAGALGKNAKIDFEGLVKLVHGKKAGGKRGRLLDMRKNAKSFLSAAKLRKLREAFQQFDEDGNGTIDMKELSAVLIQLGQRATQDEVRRMMAEAVELSQHPDRHTIDFDDFVALMAEPSRRLAQVFADRMEVLQAEMGANVMVLKQWRSLSAELNTALGRPRLLEDSAMLRVRAGVLPVRTIFVEREYVERRRGAASHEDETITHKVTCKEVQILAVSSMNYPGMWALPGGGQRLPRPENGRFDWSDAQTATDAATMHAAEEAGVTGKLTKELCQLRDPWKHVITRTFQMEEVKMHDDDSSKSKADEQSTGDVVWLEKGMRKRRWLPLFAEKVVTTGEPPPHGKLGTRYEVVSEAATELLWRHAHHRVLQAFIDGVAHAGSPLIVQLKKYWDGQPANPAHRCKVWLCTDSASDALLLGVETWFSDDPVPKNKPGPCPNLLDHEAVSVFLSSEEELAKGGRLDEQLDYLHVSIGPHGHYLVQRYEGLECVKYSCLHASQMADAGWFKDLLPREQEKRVHAVKYCKTSIANDKLKWTGIIVVPKVFIPQGRRLVGNVVSLSGSQIARRCLAWQQVPQKKLSASMEAQSVDYTSKRFGASSMRNEFSPFVSRFARTVTVPDLHSPAQFAALAIPSIPHLCNWSRDENAALAVGKKTVEAAMEAEVLRRKTDGNHEDAGWDTMGQYWDNLGRRTGGVRLRTTGYPGVGQPGVGSLPWKDKSRPPSRMPFAGTSPRGLSRGAEATAQAEHEALPE